MPVHPSTRSLKAELANLSVLSPAQFKGASMQFRPVIQRVSQQSSILQQLLVAVEEEETTPEVRSKLVAFDAALRALQRRHDAAEQQYRQLSAAFRQFEEMMQDLVDTIEASDV